jgi:hypothetical protein
LSPEDTPTWREVHALMDAKVLEIRREQDSRYRDVDSKLDRNADNVTRLREDMGGELRKIRELLSDAKDELAANKGVEKYKQWIIPTVISLVIVIIEALHLLK